MNILKKILKFIDLDPNKDIFQGDHPLTFRDELTRQCSVISVPISLLAIAAWPIFIHLDVELFPHIPFIVPLRIGYTALGLICLILSLTPYFRPRGYWLVITIIYYLGISSALIVGFTGGNPAYTGGLSLILLCIALVPIRRVHALFLLFLTLFIFQIVGSYWNLKFFTAAETYGLYNIIVSAMAAVPAIVVFDKLRERIYKKGLLLIQTNEELRKVNSLKNQLLQVAANDLKDPMQVIIGYTDLLQMKLRHNQFAHEKLTIVHRSANRMVKLIGGLLEIATIESGNMILHKSDVDFSEVVQSVIKTNERDAQKKNQKLLVEVAPGGVIHGDKMVLWQIANHLINNAIKFSPPGRSIWISLETKKIAPTEPEQEEQSNIVFTVKDEGPGLDFHEKNRLFDKFQRLSPKPTGGEISTGLGLAITRDLVKLHGGSINVESSPGKGSTFTVQFPAL